MARVKCILAINKPEIENWMHGISREGNLAKVPIWDDIEVADILQQPKDIIASIENNYPTIVFISNMSGELDSIKMTLKRCKQFYSDVRVVVLLFGGTPENIQSSQELIYYCIDNKITYDLITKVTALTIQKSVFTKMTEEQAQELKDPSFVPTPQLVEKPNNTSELVASEDTELPKKRQLSDFLPKKKEVLSSNTPNESELEEKAKLLREEQARQEREAEEKAKQAREAEEQAKIAREAEEQARQAREREEQARQAREREEQARIAREAEEQARLQREEQLHRENEELMKRDEEAKREREEQDRLARIAQAKQEEEERIARENEERNHVAQFPHKTNSIPSEDTNSKLGSMFKKNKTVIKMDQSEHGELPKQSPSFPFAEGQIPSIQIGPNTQITKGPSQFVNPKVVTFWSPKAIGKTTVLSNMAVQAAKLGIKTIATDMNVVTHDLGAYFGLPRKTPGFEQLLDYKISEDAIKSLLQNKCGVDILPIGMERARYDLTIEENQVKDALNILTRRMEYTLILVDICNIIDEVATATMLYQSDVIYLVVDQNKSFLEDVYNDLIFAEEVMQIPRNKFRLIINNYVARCDMSQTRIENFLKMQAVAVIPSDRYGHIQAVNYGKPYCTTKTEDTPIWNSLVANAIGKDIEEKQGVFNKLGKMFKN